MNAAVLRTLVHVQSHLDGDLSLQSLASIAGMSPSGLHRTFREQVGETPRDYVERVRLERGAFRLQLHRDKVLTIALDVGYANHETFTRAFRRRFGRPPRSFRQESQALPADGGRQPGNEADYQLSSTRAREVGPVRMAFTRHVGPYEAVPGDLWDRVAGFLRADGHPDDGTRVGVGHDSPALTDPAKLRFDAGILVKHAFSGRGGVGYQVLQPSWMAVTTHVGPFWTLPEAYPVIFQQAQRLKGYEVLGLPAIEMYHSQVVDPECVLNYTDIYLPLLERHGP